MQIQFLGLGFEVGQQNKGLARSHEHARTYFSVLNQIGIQIRDCGHVSLVDHQFYPKIHSETEMLKWNWEPYRKAYELIYNQLKQKKFLLNWGGDHSVALSTVGAFCSAHRDGYVLWIDAHADLNLPKHSLTGNFHGMPVSILLDLEDIRQRHFKWMSRALRTDRLIYLGLRDLDPFEWTVIKSMGIKYYTTEDVKRLGIRCVAQEIFNLVQDTPLHISFDIDSVDPSMALATGIKVSNGLLLEDIKILGSTLAHVNCLSSIDIVEINPELADTVEVERTYLTALSFLKSLLLPAKNNSSDMVPYLF